MRTDKMLRLAESRAACRYALRAMGWWADRNPGTNTSCTYYRGMDSQIFGTLYSQCWITAARHRMPE